MLEKIGICVNQYRPLCRMLAGTDIFELSRMGRRYFSSLNGRVLMMSKSDRDFADRGVPVLASMIRSVLGKKGSTLKIATTAKKPDSMEQILKSIQNNLDSAECYVLEIKPDEIQDNSPKESPKTSFEQRLSNFSGYVEEVEKNVGDIRHFSGILLRTNIVKDMWGGREVTAVLNGIKAGMAGLEAEAEAIDFCMEKSSAAARYLMACMNNPKARQQAREAAARVIDGFSTIKTYISETGQTLHGLYTIDRVFKASTGYPATWFLMGSHLTDFQYEYDTLMGNLIKAASLEADTIEPLLAWKIGVMNVG